ncbi:hypothetical protein [Nostoc sp.]
MRTVYKQVLGNVLIDSERQAVPESQFKRGENQRSQLCASRC